VCFMRIGYYNGPPKRTVRPGFLTATVWPTSDTPQEMGASNLASEMREIAPARLHLRLAEH